MGSNGLGHITPIFLLLCQLPVSFFQSQFNWLHILQHPLQNLFVCKNVGNATSFLLCEFSDQQLLFLCTYSLGSLELLRIVSKSASSLNRRGSYLFPLLPRDFNISSEWFMMWATILRPNLGVLHFYNCQNTTSIILKNACKISLCQKTYFLIPLRRPKALFYMYCFTSGLETFCLCPEKAHFQY